MELQIFESTEFGSVRAVEINNEPWLVGKDVTDVLGYQNASKALSDHVDDEDKLNNESLSSLGQRGGWLINESGFYALVLGSKLPTAKKFKHWVTSEVLPSIRKHGAYMNEQTLEQALTSPDFLIRLATELKNEKTKNKELTNKTLIQEQVIGELKPKADYLDIILHNKTLSPITLIAKDYGYSARAFNKVLHDLGVQYKVDKQWVLYSKYQGFGYTHSRQYPELTNGKGELITNMEWTQKGRLFLYNFLKKHNIIPMIEQD